MSTFHMFQVYFIGVISGVLGITVLALLNDVRKRRKLGLDK